MQKQKTINPHQHNKEFHSKFTGKIEYMQKYGPSQIIQSCNTLLNLNNSTVDPTFKNGSVDYKHTNKDVLNYQEKQKQRGSNRMQEKAKIFRNHSLLADSRYSQSLLNQKEVLDSYYNQKVDNPSQNRTYNNQYNQLTTQNRNNQYMKHNKINSVTKRVSTNYDDQIDVNLKLIFDKLDQNKSHYIDQFQMNKNARSNSNFQSQMQSNNDSYAQIQSSRNSRINTHVSQFNLVKKNSNINQQLNKKTNNQVYAKMLFNS